MTTTTDEFGIDFAQPFLVPPHIEAEGGVELHVVHQMADVENIVSGFMDRSPAPVGMRLTGGCAANQNRVEMLRFFREGYRNYRGFLSTGATTEAVQGEDGLWELNPIICDVPGMLVAQDPAGIVTVSTVPRVGKFRLREQTRLVLTDEWGTTPLNPRMHCIVAVQPHKSHLAYGWEGDVDDGFSAFDTYRLDRGWPFGLSVWNGGKVTCREIKRSAQDHDWPTFIVEGSDRAADWFAEYFRTGVPHKDIPRDWHLSDNALAKLVVVPIDRPKLLNRKLVEHGFIEAAA